MPLLRISTAKQFHSEDQNRILTAASALVAKELGIAPDRVYIEFVDAPRTMWGFNGSTFG
ncbi:MAG: phenylpyruvate tautomerase MIF-related protein [Alkalispirochaetaceae bacterium]